MRRQRSIALCVIALLGVGALLATVLVVRPTPAVAQTDDMIIQNNNAFLMAMGQGSRIELHAVDVEKESWTQLASTAAAGDTQITVQETTGWEAGDRIAIASTSTDWQQAEEFTIRSISGNTITLDSPLEFSHRGETVRYDNGQTGADARQWDVEIRAEVALLNRNITIQGDADSVNDGFGAHTMVHPGGAQHIQGVEYVRVGQRDLLGRYPLHWHLAGEIEGQYIEGVSVHESYQKGITIHGASNTRVEDNVIYDHVGHGVFLEDGAENDNQILGNLVFSTQESETGLPIPTDADHASSFWIENPNNVIIGNHAAGSESNGFWIFEDLLHGSSEELGLGEAGDLSDLIFIDNVGHTTSGNPSSGGTDKVLGIDGRLTDNLDFRQSTRTGEFGIIEGFTAYSGHTWSVTHELVFSNSAFINGGFFVRHENIIENSVFDGVRNVLYRDGGNQYNNSYATGDTRFLTLSSGHVNTAHALNNVVFDGRARTEIGNDAKNQQSIVDIDGSVTGVAGGFITPANDRFKAAPGAVGVPDGNGLLSEFTVGATEVTALGINGNVRILRSDGESVNDLPTSQDSRDRGDDDRDRSDANYEFFTTVGMERDLAYLLDLDDMPDELTLNLTDVRAGDAAVYEIPGIVGNYRVTSDDVRVDSFDELLSSNATSYYRDLASGSVFVRLVAVDNGVENGRPITDLLANYRASESITMDITGFDGSSGDLSGGIIDAIARSAPNGLNNDAPEIYESEHSIADYQLRRYGSTSDTTVVTNAMARWSENIWDGNAPGRNDTVVINAGETVVLDQSTTVKGIIVNGGELIIEDDANLDIDLSTDYLLVINGGLFQGGTESDLLDTDFTLTLEGDDPGFDLNVTAAVTGQANNIVTLGSGSGSAPATTAAPTTAAPTTAAPTTAAPVTTAPGSAPAPEAPTTESPTTTAPPAAPPGKQVGGEVVSCGAMTVTVDLARGDTGTDGDDVILGTDGDDVINGFGGNDIICAGGGDDVISAGDGADIVFAGSGADIIVAGQGRDTVYGQGGDDFVSGGKGKDVIVGGGGDDELRGNNGTDFISGGTGNDVINGGQKADVLQGGGGQDFLSGGTRPDTLDGGDGLDEYVGGGGNDTCVVDPGGLLETATSCER